jgi:cell division protein ZapA (FtsZ GTPase activity inhibitor)
MNASTKLHQLESKISELQSQHRLLLKERQQEIAALLTMLDLSSVNDKILTGGLLFLKEKITTQSSIMEARCR